MCKVSRREGAGKTGKRKRVRGKRSWYTIWKADTDELVCCGDAKECAAFLGISKGSFYGMLAEQRKRKRKGRQKYEILQELLSAEEWRILEDDAVKAR